MSDWATGQVGPYFISPDEPWRNGYVESFNSRIRYGDNAVTGLAGARMRDGSAGGLAAD
jgi:hypothetical protein